MGDYLGTYAGFRIIQDKSLVNVTEDWSRVRSPSRACRRRKQGHPQRIKITATPKPDVYRFGDTLVMHPETWRALKMELPAPRRHEDAASSSIKSPSDAKGEPGMPGAGPIAPARASRS